MINNTQESIYRLDNLNNEYRRVSYQMSTGRKLENGSDNATLFAREIYVEDKIKVYDGIKEQLDKTTVHNNVSDSALAEVKTLLEQIKSELIKANTDSTTDEGRKSIAVSIAGVKENLLDLANTKIDGEYLFSGSDSSIRPFEENAAGEIEYKGDNRLRKIAVDEGSYRDKGVNGFDMMMYNVDTATKNSPNLDFKETDRIVDQDGFEWKLNAAKTAIEQYDYNGNITDTKAVTNVAGTPPVYTVDVGNVDGTKFEAKASIFDSIDNIVNGLNKVDELGNPITDAQAEAQLDIGLENINNSHDAVNIAHAELGGRNKVFEVSEEKVSAKLTQYNVMFQEIGGADLAKVAVEAKALEATYTALYSTINKTNELSLVNFIN